MLNWDYESDVKLVESQKAVEWTDSLTRERYIEFYENNMCEPNIYLHGWEPINHLKIEFGEDDNPLPKYDALLVRRCHMKHQDNLCEETTYPDSTDDYVEDYNGDFYDGTGHLFSTHCCGGWFYNNRRCACGTKKILRVDDSDYDGFSYINLDSITPIGYESNF